MRIHQVMVNLVFGVALSFAGWFFLRLTQATTGPEVKTPRTDFPTASETWTVISIHDGDTIQVEQGDRVERIRFACIDSPELSQPLGPASRDNLQSLISQGGGQVQLQVTDTDQYGRKVAEVFAAGKLLQVEQAQAGLAYVYHRYLNNCPDAQMVESAEAIAKQNKVGVWSGNYEKPWDYRRFQR